MAKPTLPGTRKVLLGNHRYVNKSRSVVVELIPTRDPDFWHVALFRSGYLRATSTPKPAVFLAELLAAIGFDAPVRSEWQGQRHLPCKANPYRDYTIRGFVYYIEAKGSDLIKIGTSHNVHSRLATFQATSPAKLSVLFTCSGGQKQEAMLHRRFKAHRQHREWFRRAPEILAFMDEVQDARILYDMLAQPWSEEWLPRVSAAQDWYDREAEYDEDPKIKTGPILRATSIRRRPAP
jgi:hypothetical protein